MTASKRYLFRACSSQGGSHCPLCSGRDSKIGRGVESFKWKKGRLQGCPDWRQLAEEAGGGHPVHIWLSIVDPKLETDKY